MPAAEASQERPAILVVEDDPDSARYVTEVLGGGYDVVAVGTPAQAIEAASRRTWDLILVDLMLPQMSGSELVEVLREHDPFVPVAVMTAFVTVDHAVAALRRHADEFLEKPIDKAVLTSMAVTLVAKGRAARASASETVLAIGAHPDDVEIGAAGTLLVHRGLGHQVTILTLSHGARGGQETVRARESAQAAELIGAELVLEDLDDTKISEGDPTISVIGRIVERVRPTIVYTHSISDLHQDHRNAHKAAMVACRFVERVYCFQSPWATVQFTPSVFVSIDDQMASKLGAVAAFSSQADIRDYMRSDLLEASCRYWGRYSDGDYAEPFEMIRDRQPMLSGTNASAMALAHANPAAGDVR